MTGNRTNENSNQISWNFNLSQTWKGKQDPDNIKVAGEIYFGKTRKWVPQQDTPEKMLDQARILIDAHLDKKMLIEDRWFREAIV